MEYNGLQIMTAKSQIQVHNRFFLKETHKLSETIDFLASLTRVITARQLNKDLHIIPTNRLSRPTYGDLQTRLRQDYPDTPYHISFEAYQSLNDKNASSTLRDKFARMMMCVKGMSAEKVSAVLDVWETPRAMWEDLKAHERDWARKEPERERANEGGGESEGGKKKGKSRERGKDMFFADRVKGEGRRKIGDALSRDVSCVCP